MCIACELGLLIAMDDLPDAPPPGFPRAPSRGRAEFVCDAPPGADPQQDEQGPRKSANCE